MQKFSRAVLVVVMVGALILGLSGGLVLGKKGSDTPENASVDGKTKPQWKFKQSACTLAIDVHSNVNLDRQELNPGSNLIWSDYFNDSSLTVSTESTCTDGYNVQVYASNTHPGSVDVLDDFGLAAELGSTNAPDASVDLPSPSSNPEDWAEFDGTGEGNRIDVGSVDGMDVNEDGNGNYGNLKPIDGTEWVMDYRYKMDNEDITDQRYFVELTYVVSSQ